MRTRSYTASINSETFRAEERGSAMVIALFVLVLVSLFVVLATSRTAAEAFAVGNEASEGRTVYAAQGSLEIMTHNFNKVFERRLNPTQADLDIVEDPARANAVPGFENYNFVPELDEIVLSNEEKTVVLPGGDFAGLYAIRRSYRLKTTVTDPQGTQVELTRNVLNNQIPIFQFGVFYDDDLELFNGPRFGFGGRVHSNRHFFLHPSSNGAFFDSRVTAAGHIVTETKRNGDTVNIGSALTRIRNASGTYVQLFPNEGSVLNGTPNIFGSGPWQDSQLPSSRINPNWTTTFGRFDGNLVAESPKLNLPLKIGSNTDLIELVRRAKNVPGANGGDLTNNAGTVEAVTNPTADDEIMRAERFANKTGIRVTLADRKERLPGCATASGTAITGICGIRLDGNPDGLGGDFLIGGSKGYDRMRMKLNTADTGFGYVPTRVNGERLASGGTVSGGAARETWIKIETVQTDPSDDSIVTKDITADILSLGVTEQAPVGLAITGYDHTAPDNVPAGGSNITSTTARAPYQGTDSRSIIKLQRFAIPGLQIPNPTGSPAPTPSLSYSGILNYVRRFTGSNTTEVANNCTTGCTADDREASGRERFGHLKHRSGNEAIVPFPIKMFDTREGMYYDIKNKTYYPDSSFDNYQRLPHNGVMSMVDIDVANLRRFLRGDFDGLFDPSTQFGLTAGRGLRHDDIPTNSGWVLYLSDRRGDYDFDGELDMEDVYGPNDGTLQPGEDLDPEGSPGHGVLDAPLYGFETEVFLSTGAALPSYADWAATMDHKYYRRGFRLINGRTLPGVYDSVAEGNTKGFTVASENGVYVQGNYNATGANNPPGVGNTPYDGYQPFNTPVHIPASIVADAVTILSNGWDDTKSFRHPWDLNSRVATPTQIRFAMISGDTITSITGSPNQGGGDARLNGGLHNFKRFMEAWGGVRLDYTGSLINLYNSRNNNGPFKCCNTVYGAPNRNWVFDSTFLNPSRIPPGTPFFQDIQTTGFLRTND